MSYVDQLLAQNEDIKYETHQHPFVFFSRILAELAVMAVLVVALIAVSQQQNGLNKNSLQETYLNKKK